MESSIRQMYWGARTESGSAGTQVDANPYRVLSERIQQALSARFPELRLCAMRIEREERLIDGLVCQGYHIAVEVSVAPQRASPKGVRALECEIEGLLSVSLLDVLTPVHVDWVASVQ